MTEDDRPSQIMDLMAAFGRRNKSSTNSPSAEPDTGIVANHELCADKFGHSKRLRASRLKSTGARIRVLTVLADAAPDCLDATELYRILNLQSEHIPQATIYRVLNDLWGAGIVIRNVSIHGRTYFAVKPDVPSATLDTLTCLCGKRLMFIEDQTLREHLCSIAGDAGFDIGSEPGFTISVACSACRKSKDAW